MSEVVDGSLGQPVDSDAAAQPSTTGSLLRQARESKSLSLEDLGAALKVSVAKLEALEQDRWEELTDTVFARSLALSVCRVLDIDAAPIRASLPKQVITKLAHNPEGLNAPYKDKPLASLKSSSATTSVSKLWVLLAILVLVAAVVGGVHWWQQRQQESDVSAEVNAVSSVNNVSPEPAPIGEHLFVPALPDTVVVSVPMSQLKSAAPVAALMGPVVPGKPDSTVLVDAVPIRSHGVNTASRALESAAVVLAVQETVKPMGTTQVLRFSASEPSWIRVDDGQKQTIVEKVLQPGDVFLQEASVNHPLHVVVGNVQATELEINGAAFDLVKIAKNNVARFEVK